MVYMQYIYLHTVAVVESNLFLSSVEKLKKIYPEVKHVEKGSR